MSADFFLLCSFSKFFLLQVLFAIDTHLDQEYIRGELGISRSHEAPSPTT